VSPARFELATHSLKGFCTPRETKQYGNNGKKPPQKLAFFNLNML
jgi:hypothetical protein